MTEPDFEGAKTQQAIANRIALQSNPYAPFVQAKIKSQALRTGQPHAPADIAAICKRLPEDDFLASLLCKDPGRQTLHQKTAASYLKGFFADLETLPSGGPGALYVSGGKVVAKAGQTGHGQTKSIDFTWTHQGLRIYALHKYTFEEGGAQDNQARDALSFIEHARENMDQRTLFLALCDGPYYQKLHDPKSSPLTRMAWYNQLGNGQRAFCMTTGRAAAAILSGTIPRSLP